MSSDETSSVIHRKARHGRADFDARAMSPAKALRLSLEKCGDRLFRLALTVCAVEQRGVSHAALKDEEMEDALILLLDGQAGARGAALLDRQFVQALVEVQTMGRVRPGPAAERPFTGTDAAIAAPLLDAMLEGFVTTMEEAAPNFRAGQFRFGDRVGDMRGLMLALDAPDFELIRITVDIAGGGKTGVMTLILPAAAFDAPDPAAGEEGRGDRFALGELAMTAPVTLDAVLDRVEMPLAQVCKLAPGMTLPLSASAIGRTELVAARGHVAATVRLGQMNGFRAVRLTGGAMADAPAAGGEAGAGRPEAPPELPGEPADGPPEHFEAGDGKGDDAADPPGLPDQDTGGPPDAQVDDLPDLPGLSGSDDLPGLPDLPALDDAP